MDGQRVLVLHDVLDGFVHQCGGGDGRVAQGVVEDVLLPHDRRLPQAVLEQLADLGAHGAKVVHTLVQHILLLFRSDV